MVVRSAFSNTFCCYGFYSVAYPSLSLAFYFMKTLKTLASIVSAACLPWGIVAITLVCLNGCGGDTITHALNNKVVKDANGHYYKLRADFGNFADRYYVDDLGTNITFKAEQ